MGSMRRAPHLMNPLTFREKHTLLNSICVYLIIQSGGRNTFVYLRPEQTVDILGPRPEAALLNHGAIWFLISSSEGAWTERSPENM